jgi:hypothetical protein
MAYSKLSDEELIELAQQQIEDDGDRFDVAYYQERFSLFDGQYRVFIEHLYAHYQNWSIDPIGLEIFKDMLNLSRKDKDSVFIDKEMCILDLDKLIGTYVKKERERQKEERLRKVSGTKPKT